MYSNADFENSPNTHDRLLRDLVRETGYAFVFPYYTPAPDARYLTQLEESYAVLEWIAANGASKGLKTDRFAIAGDSVGGKAFQSLFPHHPSPFSLAVIELFLTLRKATWHSPSAL